MPLIEKQAILERNCLLLLAYYSVRLNSSNCKVKTIKCTYQNGGGTMKKILLVDDEHSFLQILDISLSKYFETYIATGVREAIDILKQNEIDLICSDLYMRDGTGVDLLQTVKKYNRNISFILLSGSDYNFDIKMAEHYGATFIPKGEIDLIKQIVSIADKSKKSIE